jgi:hypothetical protein
VVTRYSSRPHTSKPCQRNFNFATRESKERDETQSIEPISVKEHFCGDAGDDDRGCFLEDFFNGQEASQTFPRPVVVVVVVVLRSIRGKVHAWSFNSG